MSSESNNTLSTCNYASLGRYEGLNRLPNTLNNISVRYPVVPNYQLVPYFAGTGDYSKPNYNTLCKGSCYNYANINQAYIDCSNPASGKACSLNGGNCVVYAPRQCDVAKNFGAYGFDCSDGCKTVMEGGRYKTVDECRANCPSGPSSVPSAPTMMPSGQPMMPTMMPSGPTPF
jgi:hypothetical protein